MRTTLAPLLGLALQINACAGAKPVLEKPDSATSQLQARLHHQLVCAVTQEDTKKCCAGFEAGKACWEGPGNEVDSLLREESVLIETDRNQQRVVRLVKYPALLRKIQLSFSEYIDYALEHIDSAEEIGIFVDHTIRHDETPQNMLLSGEEVLTEGRGDCDNIANVGRELLLRLGRKKGHDFKPKILGQGEAIHAVLIFFDEDGRWKSFDQHMPMIALQTKNGAFDLSSASSIFSAALEMRTTGLKPTDPAPSLKFFESAPLQTPYAGKGAFIQKHSLDPRTLETDYSSAYVKTYTPFNPQRVPNDFYASADWNNFQQFWIEYTDVKVLYEKGLLVQRTYLHKDRTIEADFYNRQTGKISQREFSNGQWEFYDPQGVLIQRKFVNGDFEAFKQGKLIQKVYKAGPLAVEHFDPSTGKLVERDFRDGRIEWYGENGKVIQLKDKNGKITLLD